MGHGWSTYSARTIARLQAEGRGVGVGRDYHPWLTVRDVSSLGLSTRARGWKTERVHHMLSNLELRYFYALEWSSLVTDIREQYPLPLADTQRIAQELGVAYPCHPSMRTPVVMTTDFLITRRKARVFVDEARTVKPSRDLAKLRTLEKLEIERIYWIEQGIDWGIVTEHECHPTLANNMELIHEPHNYAATTPLTPIELAETVRLLTELVDALIGVWQLFDQRGGDWSQPDIRQDLTRLRSLIDAYLSRGADPPSHRATR